MSIFSISSAYGGWRDERLVRRDGRRQGRCRRGIIWGRGKDLRGLMSGRHDWDMRGNLNLDLVRTGVLECFHPGLVTPSSSHRLPVKDCSRIPPERGHRIRIALSSYMGKYDDWNCEYIFIMNGALNRSNILKLIDVTDYEWVRAARRPAQTCLLGLMKKTKGKSVADLIATREARPARYGGGWLKKCGREGGVECIKRVEAVAAREREDEIEDRMEGMGWDGACGEGGVGRGGRGCDGENVRRTTGRGRQAAGVTHAGVEEEEWRGRLGPTGEHMERMARGGVRREKWGGVREGDVRARERHGGEDSGGARNIDAGEGKGHSALRGGTDRWERGGEGKMKIDMGGNRLMVTDGLGNASAE
ncbi:hypothetical protein DFH09DRAFT_1110402 [Mycena vulgaris]|nr:hypothetical protein DFH09DRAFT_1110402 [Mycena vulgaris]